jgi:hypothetical protein
MKKNSVIVGLTFLLLLSMIALNHMTNRVDEARAYIKALEHDYPEFVDTTSGTDAYNNWYNY